MEVKSMSDDLTARVESWPDKAIAVTVRNQGGYETAARMLQDIKGLRKEVAATFGPLVQKAHGTWQEALKKRKEHDGPLEQAEQLLKSAMGAFVEAEAQRRRDEQRRLEAEARRQDEERRLAEAVKLEAAGRKVAAERVLDDPAPPPPPPPQAPVARPHAAGVSTREVWTAEVTDLLKLVRAVAQGQVPITVLQANVSELNRMAATMKSAMHFPGVEVRRAQRVASRSS